MGHLRIQGLVRMANMVRRDLAQPISSARKDMLARLVLDSIADVDRILADHKTTIRALPSPSRRAYEFLAGLDLRLVDSTAPADADCLPRESVAVAGLASHWEKYLNAMALPDARSKADRLHELISGSSQNIEQSLKADGVQPHMLTARTRQIRGWLAFFAQRENFDAYLDAIDMAKAAFDPLFRPDGRFIAPAFIHFRPTHSLYQLRAYQNGTRVVLPTPMISFSADLLMLVASMALDGVRAKQQVMEATLSDEYQEIQAELDALGGVEEREAGIYHNLIMSFERVNRVYFENALARPRLTWSKVFTGRKFGHYDRIRDTVMLSSSLDREDVPEYVVDSVMHHELLHKKLGVDWRNGRMAAHTSELRQHAQGFSHYSEDETILKSLAAGRPGTTNSLYPLGVHPASLCNQPYPGDLNSRKRDSFLPRCGVRSAKILV